VLTATNYRRHRSAGLPGFNAQVEEQGLRPAQRLLEVAEVPAPEDIATQLAVESGSTVIVRRRLFLVEDEPVALCDSYFPADLVRDTEIAGTQLIRGGAARVIEDPEGPIASALTRSVDVLAARMPTPAEVSLLGLDGGQPVVRVLRTLFTSADVPIEVQHTVAAAERHAFRYEVQL
jgi:GntR family transcriptional regulator